MPDNLDSLRQMEGFPIGKDEDLQALSNPPYYTAYPNPHIADFIKKYGNPYDEATDDYHREPFVGDISEGKTDPIYSAHGYHTKVPHKAIQQFIEHYTESRDIVLDGFCGTGMTGVAAQTLGRYVILCELSPAASNIAYNYNTAVDSSILAKVFRDCLDRLNNECGDLYKITDKSTGKHDVINSIVWSEVFSCPYCKSRIIYWDIATNHNQVLLDDLLPCPSCNAELKKSDLIRVSDKNGRNYLKPVYLDYSVGDKRLRRKVMPDDEAQILSLESREIPYWYPTEKMLFKGSEWGDTWRAGYHAGYERVSDFYFKRSIWVLSALHSFALSQSDPLISQRLLYWLTSVCFAATKLYKYRTSGGGQPAGNNLYIPSLIKEQNVLQMLQRKADDIIKAEEYKKYSLEQGFRITTGSTTSLPFIPESSVDYIFIDPPFGGNIMYSESNFIWESWLKVFTNTKAEAIMNQTQKKEISDYRDLMLSSFAEMYRILKPARWITVEFHNSSAAVWNVIQETLSKAGLIVAQVAILDKQQKTFKQVTSPGAVKNDLVINAYKPRTGFTQQLVSQAGRGLETDFVREHLRQLPVAANAERSKEMLYSKYLAYYVQHGYQVVYNGEQFYRALSQWGLEERDGYWFVDETQAHEYEQRKIKSYGKKGIVPQAVLFISDERSARQWVWNFLDEPKTYDEIYTAFVKALQTSEDEIPELKIMLEESFVRTNGHWKRPDQLTQAELEQKRFERLMRQFNEYLESAQAGQKLKEVRREAILAGFTECYRKGRFNEIVLLGQKLDKRLLEESPDLFDFVDIANAKVEE